MGNEEAVWCSVYDSDAHSSVVHAGKCRRRHWRDERHMREQADMVVE